MKRLWFFLGIYLLLVKSVFACSCVGDSSPCSAFADTPVVFLGKVIRDTGDPNLGSRFGRLRIEEVLHGLPNDLREVDVDIWPGTSCFMALKQDEQYVIYGSRDPKIPDLVHYHACSHSFMVRDNELLLDALRVAKEGGCPRLSGFVYQKVGKFAHKQAGPGIVVVAEREGERLETSTINGGQFEFRAIKPGPWTVKVNFPGWINENIPPKKSALLVPRNSCGNSLTPSPDTALRGERAPATLPAAADRECPS